MIKITNLNKYFYRKKSNEIHVINNVSLQFPQTGLVSILGESGSGKTTLMNVIGGLDDFHSGTIEIDNLKINKYSAKVMDRIRNEKIGYIFQNYLLLQQRTVYENLKIMLNMYDISEEEKNERIDYVLKAVGMMKYKKKNVSELSGGQQQRVAIARALIKSPTLILADEPTGNLDEKNTIQIMNIIKKISKNTLVILISHEKSIATSYSDYIIEVNDGKITKQSEVNGDNIYQYEDDQNIYLKEFEYKSISNDNVDIDFYGTTNEKVNIKIIYQKGKFYIQTKEDIVYLNENTEIKVLDEHKKALDTDKEILDNKFELKTLKYQKTPALSFKEQIKLAMSNLTKMKKRTLFLAFPLIIMIVLMLFSVQSVVSASIVDRQHAVYRDSNIYNIKLEKNHAMVGNPAARFGFEKFYDDFFENNPNIEPLVTVNTDFTFTLPNFTQMDNTKYVLKGCSLLTTEHVNEEDLIYGRMPENASEIVIEKWVLENSISESTIENFMEVSSFINKEISLRDKSYKFKIVGIASTDENTMYLNKWALVNLFPGPLKRSGDTVCSFSELENYIGKDVTSSLTTTQGLVNENKVFPYQTKDLIINEDDDLVVDIVDKVSFGDCPYNFAVSDEIYDDIVRSLLAYNYERLDVYVESDAEKQQIYNYVKSVEEYFANGELKATEEFGFPADEPIDFKDVMLLITATSDYDNLLYPYVYAANKNVTSRLLVTFAIMAISIVIVFFSMKSYATKGIYDIGVYRAIGINKRSIVFVYSLQTLIISLQTTFIGGTLCFLISNLIPIITLADNNIAISLDLYVLCTLGMILLNVIVGTLPVIMYMRMTPSQILTKYDV